MSKLSKLLDGDTFFERLSKKVLKTPRALQMHEWRKWEKEKEAEMPIRWILFHEIPSKIHSFFYGWGMRWYHFKSRFITKPHVIVLDVNRWNHEEPIRRWGNFGYMDPDHKLEMVLTQIFVEFVEHSVINSNSHIAWDEDSMKPRHDEYIEIYEWLTKTYPERLKKVQGPDAKEFGLSHNWFKDDDNGLPSVNGVYNDPDITARQAAYRDAIRDCFAREEELRKEHNEWLKKIIDVKDGLWD